MKDAKRKKRYYTPAGYCPAGIGARVGFASRRTPRYFRFRRCDIFYRFRLLRGFKPLFASRTRAGSIAMLFPLS